LNLIWLCVLAVGVFCFLIPDPAEAREPDQIINIWPGFAPGELTKNPGETLPRRANEIPPATRISGITLPRLHVYEPKENKAGTAVLIFPGGGYNYVVVDKEGSEAAEWLNGLGITAFVVHYRTKPKTNAASAPMWLRPVQDGQRAVSLVRQRAKEWDLKPDQIGVMGFSAGGQAAALVGTRFSRRDYAALDETDNFSCRPDFCVLVYPWRIADEKTGRLIDDVTVTKDTPPTLLVHAHDDGATSLSSIYFYTAMKKLDLPCELHIYGSGGHGYGMRPAKGTPISTWTDRVADWLKQRNLISDESSGRK
jgi:acetyl esterase/lipase